MVVCINWNPIIAYMYFARLGNEKQQNSKDKGLTLLWEFPSKNSDTEIAQSIRLVKSTAVPTTSPGPHTFSTSHGNIKALWIIVWDIKVPWKCLHRSANCLIQMNSSEPLPPPVRLVKAGVPVCLAALFTAHGFKRKKSVFFCTLEHCLKQELGEHFKNLHTQQI